VRWGDVRTVGISLAVAGLLFTACGDSSGSGPKLTGPGGATTTSTSRPTTTTAAPTTTAPSGPPTVVSTTPPGANLGTPKLSDRSTVSTAGLDAVLFGMTIAQAEKAAGTRLLPDPAFPAGPQCIVLKPEKGPEGVWFTITKGVVARVDIRAPSKVKTKSGAGIGSTDAQLQSLFPGRLSETATPTGKTIIYTPVDAANANYRVIFDTDGKAVTAYRSGQVPQIEPAQPC
jgi:hypothetical protein